MRQTQTKLAKKLKVSQQAVSKRLKKATGLNRKLMEAKVRRWESLAAESEISVDQKRGRLVDYERTMEIMNQNVTRVRAMLDAAFRSELPARQGGLPADRIAKMNSERLDEIYSELAKPLR